MKIFLLISLLILITTSVLADCNKDQINLNTASLEELDKLTGIGQTYAQRIIDSRPFEIIEDLLKVKGVGILTLEKIKQQNLACIENSTRFLKEIFPLKEPKKTIDLTPKTIKTLDSKEELENEGYAKYSIFIFCLLLLFLYKIKPKQKKNEWQ